MRDFVIADCELTAGAIAALTGAKLRAGDPADRPIRNIAPLDTAGASDLSFLDNSKYAGTLATTRAGACLIAPRFVEQAPRRLVVLETPQPYPAFVAVAAPPAIPSSAKAPRSTISCKSDTTFRSAGTA
jgi:UDP-3-O-[3-hydroxymyristoyl] glucosamine N-acyltransferase